MSSAGFMADPTEPIIRRQGAAPVAWSFAWVLAGVLAAVSAPATAQNYSRPVVQPVPPPALDDLEAALKTLSHNSSDVTALLQAGWASLGLGDTESALGFFRRAQAVQPQNGEIKAGLATASLRTGDPVTAVRLFAEAEASGTPMARYAADRGLAMDLVGNNLAAQQFYRQALAQKADPEISQRLALSQAIAGDQRASEATLLPMLQGRDLAAYRTRAFALAILGKSEEAVSIAQTMLPAQISGRLAPYLRYMPRLTRAQQAAAANLGQFPPASEIGRDDPQIAAFSGPASPPPQVASAAPDSRLVPAGQPLGPAARPPSPASGRAGTRTKAESKTGTKPHVKGGEVSVTYAPLPQTPAPTPSIVHPVRAATVPAQPASIPLQPGPPATRPVSLPVEQASAPVQPVPVPASASQPVLVASLDQSSSPPPAAPIAEEAPRPSLSISQPAAVSPPPDRVSLAEAFADFAKISPQARPDLDAVDISKIKPVRETARIEPPKLDPPKAEAAKPKPKAKPKPPADPQRFWVQVATGRNVKALAFDWKRLQRQGGTLLAKHEAYTAKWGATRRLLTGPYKSEAEADKAVSALKKKGFDAFEFTSDEGEEVTPLK